MYLLIIGSKLVNGQDSEVTFDPEVKTYDYEFSRKVQLVAEENTRRFGELNETISSLVDLSQGLVPKLSLEIDEALKNASERYNRVIGKMRNACAPNANEFQKKLKSFFGLVDYENGFQERLNLSKGLITRTLNATIEATEETRLISSTLFAVSAKLARISTEFDHLVSQKMAELEVASSSFEVKLLSGFFDESIAYVEWLDGSIIELDEALFSVDLDITYLHRFANGHDLLMRRIDRDDPSMQRYISKKIDKVVRNVGGLCESFLEKTSDVYSERTFD